MGRTKALRSSVTRSYASLNLSSFVLAALFRIPLHVQTKLVVELQFKDEAGVHGKGGKGNLG